MKKIKILVFSLLLLSISNLAIAGKKTGPYLGGSLGYTLWDFTGNTVNFDDKDQGYKLFGGYNFGLIPMVDLAVEGSYVDFGKASATYGTNLDVGLTAFDAFGLVCLNTGPIGIFGKAGKVWWNSDSNILTNLLNKSGNDMAYGLGVRFQIGSAAIRAEYEIYDIDVADVNFVSVGVSWTF